MTSLTGTSRIFRSATTRDAAARARDGEPITTLNWLDAAGHERIAEVQFADGTWMLVGESDIK